MWWAISALLVIAVWAGGFTHKYVRLMRQLRALNCLKPVHMAGARHRALWWFVPHKLYFSKILGFRCQ